MESLPKKIIFFFRSCSCSLNYLLDYVPHTCGITFVFGWYMKSEFYGFKQPLTLTEHSFDCIFMKRNNWNEVVQLVDIDLNLDRTIIFVFKFIGLSVTVEQHWKLNVITPLWSRVVSLVWRLASSRTVIRCTGNYGWKYERLLDIHVIRL